MPVSPDKFKAAFGLLAAADQSTTNAVELISRHLAIIEGLFHTDPLSDLAREYHAAQAVVARLNDMDDTVVQSHLEILKDKLPPIKRLITKMTAKDSTLPEGRQLIRKAMLEGDLATRITDATFVGKVKAWLNDVEDEPDIDTKDDIVGLFREDLVEAALAGGSSKDLMYQLLDSALKITGSDELSRDEIEDMEAHQQLAKFRRDKIVSQYRETEEQAAERKKQEDMAKGERFLSSEYRSINPLLAAFEALGVDPAVHQQPDYNYNSIKPQLLVEWRKIAVKRGADKGLTDTWDEVKLADTYDFVRSMARVWDEYPTPEIPGNKVARGDISRFMYAAYPALDPSKNGLGDGEHNVGINIVWPGVMSTTVGDPKEHNFISGKSFIWKFSVKDGHPGRTIGDINPAEQEVTFPVGVKLAVKKLIIRTGDDKSLKAGEFGSVAEVIAYAELS